MATAPSRSTAAKKRTIARPAPKPAFTRGEKVHIARHSLFEVPLRYQRIKGVDAYLHAVASATPIELVAIERQGVLGIFIKDVSTRMDIPVSRMFAILGVPKATAEKKAAAGELVGGSGGQAAVGLMRLLGMARAIVNNSTAPGARNFDSAKWLGRWLEVPQPALGGHKPADLISTPTGVEVVARLLGSLESGSYQ